MSENVLYQQIEQRRKESFPYHRSHSLIAGSVTAGILLAYLEHYFTYGNSEELCKTDKEFREELGMGVSEFESAKRKVKALPFITVTLKGLPRKTYYKLDERSK